MTKGERKYDLGERTARFGIAVVRFAQKIREDSVTRPLVSQIVRSGTSVGANYAEADNAQSKKDFLHKLYITKKECAETLHWLRMIASVLPMLRDDAKSLANEAKELTFIFSAIIRNSKMNKRDFHC